MFGRKDRFQISDLHLQVTTRNSTSLWQQRLNTITHLVDLVLGLHDHTPHRSAGASMAPSLNEGVQEGIPLGLMVVYYVFVVKNG